jgi:choline dehydrogenase-like flavoprotein
MNDRTTCCIAGGGPGGVMLGLILARAGVDVLVLEKHQDFFRDFRGDTIHPSTLELMHELGLLEDLLRQPHDEIRGVEAHFGDRVLHLADLSHLPAHCKFIALMPQWDFSEFSFKPCTTISAVPAAHANGSDGPAARKWKGRGREGTHAGGDARGPRRIGGGSGWPEFDCARARRYGSG